jgi:hypothetical protein
MLSDFFQFVSDLKQTKSQKMKRQLTKSSKEFGSALEFYMCAKNSPSIKKMVVNTPEERKIENVSVSKLLKLSNDLKQTQQREKKRELAQSFADQYVDPEFADLFLGLITFSISLGVTKVRESGSFRFM